MERYVAFICDELPKTRRVLLTPPPPMENGEYGYKRIYKIGPHVYMETTIEIVEKYTRSAKLCIKFEDYQMNDIFYMSRRKGPDELLEEIYNKIYNIVNKTLIDDRRQEWVREQYKIRSEKFPLFDIGPGVYIDMWGDLYRNYLQKCDEDKWMKEIVLDLPFPNKSYGLFTQEEFIDKLRTDDEFNKKWGNSTNKTEE